MGGFIVASLITEISDVRHETTHEDLESQSPRRFYLTNQACFAIFVVFVIIVIGRRSRVSIEAQDLPIRYRCVADRM